MKVLRNSKITPIIGLVIGAVIGFICFRLTGVNAGNLEPSAPPNSTMKTLDEVEPRIPIPASQSSADTFEITQSGSYYLEGNRNCSETGISISASDVTIDLCGYSLVGTDSGIYNGISITSGSNIEIKNGTIRDFGSIGIYSTNSNIKNIRMIVLRVLSNGGGISVSGVGGIVKDCTVSENAGNGISTQHGYIVSGCVVRQNGGIGINASHGNTVIDNTVYYNTGTGIKTGNACVISRNTVLDNSGNYGIDAGTACTITHNNQHNSQSGYRADPGSTVIGNVANANERYGFYIYSSLVDQNTAYDNNQVGGYANMYASSCTLGTNHAP